MIMLMNCAIMTDLYHYAAIDEAVGVTTSHEEHQNYNGQSNILNITIGQKITDKNIA